MPHSIFEKISFDNYENFIKNINNRRKNIFDTNKNIIYIINQPVDFKDISSTQLKDGRMRINYNGVRFEIFLKIHKSKKLLVTFDGSRKIINKEDWQPKFVRWTYDKIADACVLCFEDPMYYAFPDLQLGWYYGDDTTSYLSLAKDIICHIAERLDIKNENIMLFSSSGGGYASIYTASLIENSTGIALNPQLMLYNHPQSKDFTKITGIDLKLQDHLHRNNLAEAVQFGEKSKYILIVNTSSEHDMEAHFLPFCEQLGLTPSYGISQKDNITTWIYDATLLPPQTNHNAFEDRLLFLAIRYLSSNTMHIEDMYFILSEIWNERYNLLNKCNRETSSTIYDFATKYEKKLDKDDVISLMYDALKKNPENYLALSKLFNLLKDDDTQKLLDILKWHTSICFSIDEGFRLLAILLYTQNKIDAALCYAYRALHTNYCRARNHILVAQCYFKINNRTSRDRAIKILLNASSTCDNKDDIYRTLILFYLEIHDYKSAIENILYIIKIAKNKTNIDFTRNILNRYKNKLDEEKASYIEKEISI